MNWTLNGGYIQPRGYDSREEENLLKKLAVTPITVIMPKVHEH
jgi:hypothetical protein